MSAYDDGGHDRDDEIHDNFAYRVIAKLGFICLSDGDNVFESSYGSYAILRTGRRSKNAATQPYRTHVFSASPMLPIANLN